MLDIANIAHGLLEHIPHLKNPEQWQNMTMAHCHATKIYLEDFKLTIINFMPIEGSIYLNCKFAK